MPTRLSRRAGYPRRTVRITVEHLRHKPSAVAVGSAHDKLVILRDGKPRWTMVRTDYHDILVDRVRAMGLKAVSNGLPRRIGPKPAAKWRAARRG